MSKKVIILGGGPGGYIAAQRASALGAKVKLVEKDTLGGTCLNRGCIPTKVFLNSVDLFTKAKDASDIGIELEGIKLNWQKLMQRKKEVVQRLVGGVGGLMRMSNVEVIEGSAAFISSSEIEITKNDGKKVKEKADDFIIATGSEPALPPVPGFDLPGIMTSDEFLSMEKLPKSMVVIGGGVIGVELASILAPLGVKVKIVEMLPEILPNVDEDISAQMRDILTQMGIKIYIGASVKKIEGKDGAYKVSVKADKALSLEAEKVLVATGRKPNLAGLNLDKARVKLEKGRIKVDEKMATTQKGLWAIGDCASPIMLAHVASREGEIAAENIMGGSLKMDYSKVPGAVYTSPEIAWVGLTEKEARKKYGSKVQVGVSPMAHNGKSVLMKEVEGFFKIISESQYGEILGIHLMGPRATDIIGEGSLALTLEARIDDIMATIHAHPTVNESLADAVKATS